MEKAKRIYRKEITMSMDAIIKHLEKLQWLLRHNSKIDATKYPGMTNLSEIDAECVRDRIKDVFMYLKHIPGITIYDLFTDDEFKAYGIY